MRRTMCILGAAAAGAAVLCGCQAGTMSIDEKCYLAAYDPQTGDANYYRLTIKGKTTLGVAKFRQGWYPSEAVDAVLSGKTQEFNGSDLQAQRDIRAQLITAYKAAHESYLTVAQDPASTNEEVEQALRALMNIRRMPTISNSPDAQFIEYNPRAGIEINREGQKPVIFLCSNPDDIIKAIRDVTVNATTDALISDVAGVIAQREQRQHAQLLAGSAQAAADDAAILAYIDALNTSLANGDARRIAADLEALARLLRSGTP
ncbi:MAG: hypothetical protein JNK25_00620 [Phycisphaerae bacterium]|nr:hypothetical protein [Phycisphaerae bacterium]